MDSEDILSRYCDQLLFNSSSESDEEIVFKITLMGFSKTRLSNCSNNACFIIDLNITFYSTYH